MTTTCTPTHHPGLPFWKTHLPEIIFAFLSLIAVHLLDSHILPVLAYPYWIMIFVALLLRQQYAHLSWVFMAIFTLLGAIISWKFSDSPLRNDLELALTMSITPMAWLWFAPCTPNDRQFATKSWQRLSATILTLFLLMTLLVFIVALFDFTSDTYRHWFYIPLDTLLNKGFLSFIFGVAPIGIAYFISRAPKNSISNLSFTLLRYVFMPVAVISAIAFVITSLIAIITFQADSEYLIIPYYIGLFLLLGMMFIPTVHYGTTPRWLEYVMFVIALSTLCIMVSLKVLYPPFSWWFLLNPNTILVTALAFYHLLAVTPLRISLRRYSLALLLYGSVYHLFIVPLWLL